MHGSLGSSILLAAWASSLPEWRPSPEQRRPSPSATRVVLQPIHEISGAVQLPGPSIERETPPLPPRALQLASRLAGYRPARTPMVPTLDSSPYALLSYASTSDPCMSRRRQWGIHVAAAMAGPVLPTCACAVCACVSLLCIFFTVLSMFSYFIFRIWRNTKYLCS